MAELIDGRAMAGQVGGEVAEEARRLRTSGGITPGLAVVRVGEDPGSKIYVTAKRKAAEEVGFRSWEYHFDASASQADVLAQLQSLNRDPSRPGTRVHLPLPNRLRSDE